MQIYHLLFAWWGCRIHVSRPTFFGRISVYSRLFLMCMWLYMPFRLYYVAMFSPIVYSYVNNTAHVILCCLENCKGDLVYLENARHVFVLRGKRCETERSALSARLKSKGEIQVRFMSWTRKNRTSVIQSECAKSQQPRSLAAFAAPAATVSCPQQACHSDLRLSKEQNVTQ